MRSTNPARALAALILAATLIRLGFAAATGLGVDESYMVAAGRTISLGYFDHPPAAWWLSWGAAHLFGSEAPVVVRLPFILLFALSSWLVARLTLAVTADGGPADGRAAAGGAAAAGTANGRVGNAGAPDAGAVDGRTADTVTADGWAAVWAVLALNVSPVFGVTTATWVLPDGPLDCALLGAALCLVHAVQAPGTAWRWWIGAGLCAGLALFSKYSAGLVILGALAFLLADRRGRAWLGRPQPWVAGLLALAVFAPVLAWNATHGWASFAFQGDRAVGLRFHPLAPLTVWAGEALFVLPWLWVPMLLVWLPALGWPRRPVPTAHRLLAWLAAPPILLFALIAAWSSQRILFHWAAPGYLMLFPLLGRWLAARGGRGWLRRAAGATVGLVLAVLAVIGTDLRLDWLGPVLPHLVRHDPTAEGIDWLSVRQALAARGLLPPGTIVAVPNWRDAGKLGYALGPGVTVTCLNRDSRQFGFAAPARRFVGQDMLLLAVEHAGSAVAALAGDFASVTPLPPAPIQLRGRVLGQVSVYRAQDLRHWP
jgi:hypothetical protein